MQASTSAGQQAHSNVWSTAMSSELARILLREAEALQLEDAGKLHEAADLYVEATMEREHLFEVRCIADDVHAKLHNVTRAAGLYTVLGCYEDALPWRTRQLYLQKQIMGEQDSAIADTLFATGDLHKLCGRTHDALMHHREALAMRRLLYEGSKLSPSDAGLKGDSRLGDAVISSLTTVGQLLASQGDRDGGLASLLRAKSLTKRLHRSKHASVAPACSQIALVYGESGQPQEALDTLERALHIALENQSADPCAESHRVVAAAYKQLAAATEQLGFYQTALEALEQTKRVYADTLHERSASVDEGIQRLQALMASADVRLCAFTCHTLSW